MALDLHMVQLTEKVERLSMQMAQLQEDVRKLEAEHERHAEYRREQAELE